MTRSPDSLPALRDHAVAGLDHLGELLALATGLGAAVADLDDVHRPFRQVGGVDPAVLAADGRRLSAAHRAVAERLHRLPEQQVRVGQGWTGETGSQAVVAVIEHQRRAEADLHVLRILTEATAAAAAGIDQLLRTWYLTVARLSVPLVAGVRVVEVPGAIVSGRLRPDMVIDDIVSRATLYFTTAEATISGIDEILEHLDRATADMEVEAYPGDVAASGPTVFGRRGAETIPLTDAGSPVPSAGPGDGAGLAGEVSPDDVVSADESHGDRESIGTSANGPHDQPDRDIPDRDIPDRDIPDRDIPDRDIPDRDTADRDADVPLRLHASSGQSPDGRGEQHSSDPATPTDPVPRAAPRSVDSPVATTEEAAAPLSPPAAPDPTGPDPTGPDPTGPDSPGPDSSATEAVPPSPSSGGELALAGEQ